MALETVQQSHEQPHAFRWTRDDYYRLAALGMFDQARVELIDGNILQMAPPGPGHAASTTISTDAIRSAFGPGYFVRVQQPLDLGMFSQPEPDVAVIAGSPRDFTDHHPSAAVLVLEISESSLAYDRGGKADLYAAGGIPEYWIVNLLDRVVEVHRQPEEDPTSPSGFRYTSVQSVKENGVLKPLAAPAAAVRIADLLP